MKQRWKIGSLILIGLMIGGCHSDSRRMADLAERTVETQSELNSATTKTHDNFFFLNREIQQERSNLQRERNSLEQQFEKLETDRRELHQLRRSELAWAESFRFLAIVIAAITPLFLCAYLIWAATRQSSCHETVNELLIQEMVSPNPRLIRAANLRAIEHNPNERNSDSNNNGGNSGNVTRSTD